MKQRSIYGLMTAGSLVGMIAAFLQTLEKLTLIKNPNSELYCNLNSVFSCSNVLNSPQASVFGFPNSIMCLMLFTVFFSVALVGLGGGTISKKVRISIQTLSLFTLGFALWFLWQSTYRIGSLCIFCLFCFAGLLSVNWGWLRLNANDLPIPESSTKKVRLAIAAGADTFAWILLAMLVAFLMALRFF